MRKLRRGFKQASCSYSLPNAKYASFRPTASVTRFQIDPPRETHSQRLSVKRRHVERVSPNAICGGIVRAVRNGSVRSPSAIERLPLPPVKLRGSFKTLYVLSDCQ